MRAVEKPNICGKPTKKGTACRRELHSWLEDFKVRRADGCWRHMSQSFKETAAARKRVDEEAWLAFLYADPICWGWPIPEDLNSWRCMEGEAVDEQLTEEALSLLTDSPDSRATAMLIRWQDGRCAICGHRRGLVEDHDHITGMVRGWLCYGCNTQEGIYRDADTLFGKYRERHPTKMLGLEIRYWDPIRKDYAQPASKRTTEDLWTGAASEDIGL
jgi:hypothetical protein